MVRATMILERSAREAVLVSLLRSGFLLKAWRRLPERSRRRFESEPICARSGLSLPTHSSVDDADGPAPLRKGRCGLSVSSMADPFDDAPTAADVVSARRLPAVPMPSAAGTVEMCPLPT